MTIYKPYTYLIGWSQLDKWYYGVRYAKGCDPQDLWKSYFTSSKHVERYRNEHGDPDVVQTRKTFDTAKEAIQWEHKVLERLNAAHSNIWLNRANGKAIHPVDAIRGAKKSKNIGRKPWNKNYFYCVGCRKRDKPSIINKGIGHERCFKRKYGLPPATNSGWVTSKDGQKMAAKNNSSAKCPHCDKVGQYRAMKRWHFDKCKHKD